MCAIREGLDVIDFPTGAGNERGAAWTELVMGKLCKIGQRQVRCYVCVSGSHGAEAPGWLYNMTWLEYTAHKVGVEKTTGSLVDAHLVAECEWSTKVGDVEDDFSKLMLARAGVRLMICCAPWSTRGDRNKNAWGREITNAEEMADTLAEWVRRFKGTRSEDAYLLAVLGWNEGLERYGFNYFTLGLNGATPFRALLSG